MRQRGLERYAPLAGIVFLVLVVVSFVITGEPPDAGDDDTAETIAYWADNDDVNVVSAILGAIAAVALVWFAGSLRTFLRAAEGDAGRLSAIAFSGLVVVAAGAGVNSSLQFAAADTVGDVPEEVTHTISVLFAYTWFPFTIGFAITLLAAGVAALRFGALPVWLAWASIVVAVILMTPLGFFGFLLSLVWVAVVGVLLFRAADRPAEPPAAGAERAAM